MAKLSGSIDVPLPPEEAWMHASDLTRYRVADHPQGMAQQVARSAREGHGRRVVCRGQGHAQPDQVDDRAVQTPESVTLNGDGVGGVKVKLIAKVAPKEHGSVVSFDVHLGGPALLGPIGMIVAAALRADIRESLQNFVTVFAG